MVQHVTEVLVIPAQGGQKQRMEHTELTNDTLRELVGGRIQGLALGEWGTLYRDADGESAGKPMNHRATQLVIAWNPGFANDGLVVGDAIVAGPVNAQGDHTDLIGEYVTFVRRQ